MDAEHPPTAFIVVHFWPRYCHRQCLPATKKVCHSVLQSFIAFRTVLHDFFKGVCVCVYHFTLEFCSFCLLFSYTFLLYSDYTAIEILHVTQSEVTFSNFIQRATVSSDVSTETAKAAKEAGLVNELETTVNSLEATLDFSQFFLLLFHDLDEILCDGNVISLWPYLGTLTGSIHNRSYQTFHMYSRKLEDWLITSPFCLPTPWLNEESRPVEAHIETEPVEVHEDGQFLKREGEGILQLPTVLKCNPLEHILIINLEGRHQNTKHT